MYHSPSAVDGSAIQLCVPHRRHNHVHIRMEVVQTSASHPLIWYEPSTRPTYPPFPPVRRHRAANSSGSVCVCVRVGGSAYNATHPNSVVQYIICSQQRVLMRTVARHAWVRAWLLCPHTHTHIVVPVNGDIDDVDVAATTLTRAFLRVILLRRVCVCVDCSSFLGMFTKPTACMRSMATTMASLQSQSLAPLSHRGQTPCGVAGNEVTLNWCGNQFYLRHVVRCLVRRTCWPKYMEPKQTLCITDFTESINWWQCVCLLVLLIILIIFIL